MSDANVIIKQLTDKEGKLVSPFTHAHSVYTSEGTRLDYELTRIDTLSASTHATLEEYKYELNEQMDSFSAATNENIEAFKASTDTKILLFSGDTQNKFSNVNNRINNLSGETGELSETLFQVYDGVFPIQATLSFSPNASTNPTGQTITMRSYEKQRESVNYPTIMTLTKKVNGGAAKTVYSSSPSKVGNATVNDVEIEGNTEQFTLTAAQPDPLRNPGKATVTRYICASRADVATFSASIFNNATKVLSNSKSFNPTVATNQNYVWLFCPLKINKIMCNGQAFSYSYMREYTVSSGNYAGTYYVYRSNQQLGDTSWYLEIS